MRCVILVMAAHLLVCRVVAQEKFLTYKVKGKVSYQDAGKQTTVKIGKVLPATASVKVEKNSSIMIVCENSSVPIVLQEGTHALKKQLTLCKNEAPTITANYLHYVWWQFTNPKSTSEDEHRKNITSPGAVTRGCPGIDFLSPDTLNYYSENLVLRWKVHSSYKKKRLLIYQFEKSAVPLYSIDLKHDYFILEKQNLKLEGSTNYYWTIELDGEEPCERKLIQVWEKKDFDEMLDENRRLGIAGVDQAESDYFLGYVLEQKLFHGEAYHYYKMASSGNPKDKRYKRTLIRFRKYFESKKY